MEEWDEEKEGERSHIQQDAFGEIGRQEKAMGEVCLGNVPDIVFLELRLA